MTAGSAGGSWSVPAVAENLSGVRQAVCDVAREAGAGEKLCGDIALAVGEACANVVVHAYPDGAGGAMAVEVVVDGRGLVVTVTDDGRGLAPSPGSTGLGLGLPLIGSLTREMELSAGREGRGTTVTMRFDLA